MKIVSVGPSSDEPTTAGWRAAAALSLLEVVGSIVRPLLTGLQGILARYPVDHTHGIDPSRRWAELKERAHVEIELAAGQVRAERDLVTPSTSAQLDNICRRTILATAAFLSSNANDLDDRISAKAHTDRTSELIGLRESLRTDSRWLLACAESDDWIEIFCSEHDETRRLRAASTSLREHSRKYAARPQGQESNSAFSGFDQRLFWTSTPRVPLYSVGISLRPFLLYASLVDDQGNVHKRISRRLRYMEPDAVVNASAKVVRDLVGSHSDARGCEVSVGFELGGAVDNATGAVKHYQKQAFSPANIDGFAAWIDVPLRTKLENITCYPAEVFNDADAAAYHLRRRKRLARDRFGVILTREGVGSSVLLDAAPLSAAGELGHAPLFPENGKDCICGAEGCLESVAGIGGLLKTCHGRESSIRSIEDIVRRCEGPDPEEKFYEPVLRAGAALARGAGLLVSLYGPLQSVVLIGPRKLLDRESKASRGYMKKVEEYQRYVGSYDRHESRLERVYDRDDIGPRGAALGAMYRCSSTLE